jgi:oligoribonuclease NrnB/cAMP/cGMP phosphodiesterase (DHH superfamily)
MSDKALVFAHNDSDGMCAAAVLRRKIPFAWVIAYGSGTALPREKLRRGETIYLLDMAFGMEDMKFLCDGYKVVYINHHSATTKELLDAGLKFTGLWNDTDSACLLTWKYFFPEEPVPRAVELINDFDTWTFKYEQDSKALNYGLNQIITYPCSTGDLNWKRILATEPEFFEGLLDRGRSIMEYTDELYKVYASDLAYTTELCGKTFIAMNLRGIVSLAFEHCDLSQVDGVIAYRWMNNAQGYKVSLFTSERARSVTNMQEIAAQFNGGGHPGAAGFSCTKLPFKENVIEGKKVSYISPYKPVMEYIEQHPAVEAYAASTSRSTATGAAFTTTFEGLSAIGTNTPETDNRAFNALNSVNTQLGITFIWTNCGYRVIIRPLCYNVNISEIIKKYNGKMLGAIGWFYCTELPFVLNKYQR